MLPELVELVLDRGGGGGGGGGTFRPRRPPGDCCCPGEPLPNGTPPGAMTTLCLHAVDGVLFISIIGSDEVAINALGSCQRLRRYMELRNLHIAKFIWLPHCLKETDPRNHEGQTPAFQNKGFFS